MRYFVGQCEYKWSHKGLKAEQLWVRREVGDELYKEVELRDWTWVLIRSQSTMGDRYCRCDIYVDIDDPNTKYATLFPIRFKRAKAVPLAK
jgi:hypothetical protein